MLAHFVAVRALLKTHHCIIMGYSNISHAQNHHGASIFSQLSQMKLNHLGPLDCDAPYSHPRFASSLFCPLNTRAQQL